MITALLLASDQGVSPPDFGPVGEGVPSANEWTVKLRSVLARHATMLELDPELVPNIALGNLPIDLVVVEAELVTERVIDVLQQVAATYPDSVTVCVATEEAGERARIEQTIAPDFWIIVPASDLQLRTQVETIIAFVGGGDHAGRGLMSAPGGRSLARSHDKGALVGAVQSEGNGHLSRPESALYRMVGRMTGNFDTEDLLSAYCEAVHEMTQCVSYCLLWQRPNTREYEVVRAEWSFAGAAGDVPA